MTDLDHFLTTRPDRCSGCGHHQRTQGCACAGLAAARSAMVATVEARPNAAAQVEAVVRQLAATGRPFSANDARQLHGVVGGVVGAVFAGLKSAGVIRAVGAEASTDRGTHGKSVALWQGVAA